MVQAEAVVDDSGNPTGDAVVWYTRTSTATVSYPLFRTQQRRVRRQSRPAVDERNSS